MYKFNDAASKSCWRGFFVTMIAFGAIFATGSTVSAQHGAMDIGITCGGQNDTLLVGDSATFDIFIENWVPLGGLSIGFQIWSPDGAQWQWQAQPNGWGPAGQGSGKACVTLVPNSRIDPNGDGRANEVFDMTDIVIDEQNMDETGRDSLMVTGVSLMRYMEVGGMEHMISFHFAPDIPSGDVATLCMDSCFIPPNGSFVFVNTIGMAAPPITYWPPGGRCWPVIKWTPDNGDVNCDGGVNVGDAVYLINHIFKGGPPPC